MQIGTTVILNCPAGSNKPVFAFAGNDPDGDGLKSCRDPDDDNDGVADVNDPCVQTPGTNPSSCLYPGGVCYDDITFDQCSFGACDAFFLKLEKVLDPDPVAELTFDKFDLLYALTPTNETRLTAYVKGLSGRTLSETARLFSSPLTTGVPRAPIADDRVQISLWERGRTGSSLVEVLGVYDPALTVLNQITTGDWLKFPIPDGYLYQRREAEEM